MLDLVLEGGQVVDGTGSPVPGRRRHRGRPHRRRRPAGPGRGPPPPRRCRARSSPPGFIDAHVHGDLALLADPDHEPAIRQGVTTYVIGQDGVAMAPASPATLAYMRRYTAGFSGTLRPARTAGRAWPSTWPASTAGAAVNVACLIPNGNVRMEVMGLETRPPTADELKRMRRLVREAMEQGAVGLSSGLDYIPSLYADTEELTALCQEIAPFGGVYVTHMRALRPRAACSGSMDEVFRIGREAGVAVHISHFNSLAELVCRAGRGRAEGRRRHLRPVLLPGRQHHPRHGRPAAVGAGGRHRRDAGPAAGPGDAGRSCASPVRRAPRCRSRPCASATSPAPDYRQLRRRRRSRRPPQAAGR